MSQIIKIEDPRKVGEALWPSKFPLEVCQRMKAAVGSRAWNAMYQQRPTAQEGGIIKRSWFKFYKALPEKFDEQIQSWDLTFKDTKQSDFVVGQVWGRVGARRLLLDQIRARLDFPGSMQAITTLSSKWPNAYLKLVEDKANGPALMQMLSHKIPGIVGVNPSGSKEARLSAASPFFEAGNVELPDPSIAPWIHDYIEEVVGFPNMQNDDQVDATSQALERLSYAGAPQVHLLDSGDEEKELTLIQRLLRDEDDD